MNEAKKVVPIKAETEKPLAWMTAEELRDLVRGVLEQKHGRLTRVDDRLVDIDEAARILSVSKEWLYKNQKRLPFARKLGRGLLRFSVLGMAKWVETKRT